MTSTANMPRQAALTLIAHVLDEGRLLSEVTGPVLGPLSPPERARAGRLAAGTLRWMDRADRALGPFLRMKPWPKVHNALRLAIYEIFVEGAAEHGAVSAAVDLVRSDGHAAGQAGLTNGVLRNVLRKGGWDDLPLPRLPKPLRKRLLAIYGKEVVAEMEAVFAATPPLDLTPKDGDGAALAERLGGIVLPTGSVRLTVKGQVSALDGYDSGDWWVQDAAAALPARALDVQLGERVLDMCAAPGGKTLQLAAAGADVTALDNSEPRMVRMHENLARCGLPAQVVVADALTYDAPLFDAVLLDAPCSATGTIRRHPDLPQAKRDLDFSPLVAQQSAMIDAALRLVKPGGRVVFCTCSLLPEEGEEQVSAALARHPGLTVETGPLNLPGIHDDWILPGIGLRLRPDYQSEMGGMDGFFITRFRRPE
ncbi:RsmB/NOP family class I SAM-dependent RNA methyltransferase [Oceaniovalibus sp. ACAM 378]|uniref:RsmB/NOP family class I SAM-dependent RNA methyltransferase n=1 Tax=Oceaniovalibus sp. ACAM 378 TaxID=2599923 RepID=UPI0011D4569A|nr:transcription antitermination factor NusB [Oceaniovalibus sp. ACAM 378]TYB86345.1 16S rRNA methyltransferase [Oceaniovalibus sp. ACAM 378]